MNFNSFKYYASTHKKDVDKEDFNINLKYTSDIFPSITKEFIKEQIARYNTLGSNNCIWLAFFINYVYLDQKEGTVRLDLYKFEDELYVDLAENKKLNALRKGKLLSVTPEDLPRVKQFLYQQGLKRFEDINKKDSGYHFDISENSISAMSEAIKERIEHTKSLRQYRD